MVKYRHQTNPPNEYIQDNVHDVFKTIHVYGYGMCCCAASHVETLARYLGLPGPRLGINLHSVPEVYYDDSWHLVDGSLMNYFLNPDGKIASVRGHQAGRDGLARGESRAIAMNDGKLRQFAADDGWKKGPPLLASTGDSSGTATASTWPAGTAGRRPCRSTTARSYLFDYGGSMGYELNVQLRRGRAADAQLVQQGPARQHARRRRSGDSQGHLVAGHVPRSWATWPPAGSATARSSTTCRWPTARSAWGR